MEALFSYALAVLSGLLAIPVAVLALEIVAAMLRPRAGLRAMHETPSRTTVLVPAHNESVALLPTLEDIKAQLRSGDRLLVVADNCTDDTAAIARNAGADVVERNDLERIGKGYALECGLQSLKTEPPDIVVMVDADCRLSEGAIQLLASASVATMRPVQALYLMSAPLGSPVSQLVAQFAWRVKNLVRPLGLAALGLPCQLMGTGMAFPWKVISAAYLFGESIVEDLQLGLDLTLDGHPPLFCPSAIVTSSFAASARGAKVQRQRWEQGHIVMILKGVPRLMRSALLRRNFGLFALTLDLLVPPVSLLTMLVIGMLLMTGVAALLGVGSTAFVISLANFIAFTLVVMFAWLKVGREVLPLRAVLSIPSYVFGKLGIYGQVLSGRTTGKWIRSERSDL